MFTGFVKMAKVTITGTLNNQNFPTFYVETKIKNYKPFRYFTKCLFLPYIYFRKFDLSNFACL